MSFKRSCGILLHPTSFPSRYGIGDFGVSALEFIDFLKQGRQKLWQILPLGPTSFGDSPYQSFSAFAGNYLLISPEELVKDGLLAESDLTDVPAFPEDSVDYGAVLLYKKKLFLRAYRNFKEQADKEQKEAFSAFCKRKAFWLDDYCLFAALKDHFIAERKNAGFSQGFKTFERATKKFLSPNIQKDYYFGAVWSTWPEELKKRKTGALNRWQAKLKEDIRFYAFLQFLFFKQWERVKGYANENGVKIIGDIPIFVAYDSADVWKNPELFYMTEDGFPTVVAGVPPDYFSATGQLWGNPLYRWDYHKKTGYKFWISRIKETLRVVDILRIDHFRGFESYWAIPFGDLDATGGKWVKGPGADLFYKMKEVLGDLPIIAEDLGIITDEVRELRDTLQFPGMKVLQFAFDDSENNDYLPHNYIQNAVAYTGTHDNDTTIGWYQQMDEGTKDRFRRYMNVSGEDAAWDLIRLAVSSTANFAIYPLQDVLNLGTAARMNTPSVPSGNWKFRYKKGDLLPQYAERLSYLATLFYR